jgi:hypothetical protein
MGEIIVAGGGLALVALAPSNSAPHSPRKGPCACLACFLPKLSFIFIFMQDALSLFDKDSFKIDLGSLKDLPWYLCGACQKLGVGLITGFCGLDPGYTIGALSIWHGMTAVFAATSLLRT